MIETIVAAPLMKLSKSYSQWWNGKKKVLRKWEGRRALAEVVMSRNKSSNL